MTKSCGKPQDQEPPGSQLFSRTIRLADSWGGFSEPRRPTYSPPGDSPSGELRAHPYGFLKARLRAQTRMSSVGIKNIHLAPSSPNCGGKEFHRLRRPPSFQSSIAGWQRRSSAKAKASVSSAASNSMEVKIRLEQPSMKNKRKRGTPKQLTIPISQRPTVCVTVFTLWRDLALLCKRLARGLCSKHSGAPKGPARFRAGPLGGPGLNGPGNVPLASSVRRRLFWGPACSD
jgi:hypothetical protein